MRTALTVAGVLLCLTVLAGVGLWRVTEPVRFAGIDRDDAGPTGHTSRELERPGVTRREIVEMLHARDYATLTRIIESRNERALADVQEEWELGRVIDAFGIADDGIETLFDDWVQAQPESYAPLLASAQYRFTLAYLMRGARLAARTTREQFQGMREQLALLVENVEAALSKDRNLSEAYRLLIDAARAGGTQIECGIAAKQGLGIMPASYRIRAALAYCRLPRWGGSFANVQAIADQADPFFNDNPRLAALHGFVDFDRGRSAEGNEALQHLDAALLKGAHWSYYNERARVHREAKRFEEALQDSDEALTLSPDSPDVLIGRLYALLGLGRIDEIPETVALIETIDPMNTDLPAFKEYSLKVAAVEGYQLQRGNRAAESIERLTAGIALDGGDAEAYYWRGRAYLKAGNHADALADFEKAVRLDPAHFESYRNIDYILAGRKEWPAIIEHWTTYLSRKPDDGKALFERAGAYRHSGNRELAMRDARAACDLGVAAACSVVK